MRKKHLFLLLPLLAAGGMLCLGFAAVKVAERYLNGTGPSPTASGFSTSGDSHGGLPVLWTAPSFSYLDQDGRRFTNTDLHGHVWIADFIYTQCTTACPIMTAKMILLQKSIHDPAVRFVSFSVDPAHDAPAVLKQYAGMWKGDESRWRLLSTEPAALQATAVGMKVAVESSSDPANPILHSSLFTLVDQQGRVRGVYDSADENAMKRLAADATALAGGRFSGQSGADTSVAGRGQTLFSAMGCLACHRDVRVAPPLAGVFGGRVKLADGRSVPGDEAYLRESIVDPGAKLVAGYARTMPNYRDYLTTQQVDELVGYLKSLGNESVPQEAPRTVVVDPVCKMSISAGADTLHSEYGGKTYYFCSDNCRDKFLKNPSEYAKAPPADEPQK